MLLRAYQLWRELEHATGQYLLHLCGGLMMGPAGSAVVSGSKSSAVQHGLPHEMLDAKEIRRRFPALHPPAETVALFEDNAGFLLAEASVKAHLDRAHALGAQLHFEEEVIGWEADGNGIRVRSRREEYRADRLVITAGPWTGEVLAGLRLPLEVNRQVLYWFQPSVGLELFQPGRFPIFILERADGLLPYGFPASDGPKGGVKVALYRAPVQSVCAPATIERAISEAEIETMRHIIRELIPSLDGECLKAVTCMYTNTPDEHFLIDTHSEFSNVAYACGFSGHGFKFAGVVGEILADLATTGHATPNADFLRAQRFSGR
jgi:sarcosine oxidase